jgi:peptidoglycan hydrolase CwlO-like protein
MCGCDRCNGLFEALSDLRRDVKEVHGILRQIKMTSDDTNERVMKMAVDIDKLTADVQTLVAGGQAKDLLIAQLQAELASADADAQARVDAAVAAEDSDAQSKIDAADAVADSYLNPAPPASGRKR